MKDIDCRESGKREQPKPNYHTLLPMKSVLLATLLLPNLHVSSAVDRFEVNYAKPLPYQNDVAWVTSKNNCSIQARNAANGSVMWSQHFCSGTSDKHDTAILGEGVYTFDSGVLRSWHVGTGVKWETNMLSELSDPTDSDPFVVDNTPRLLSAQTSSNTILAIIVSKGNREGLVLVNSATGKIIKPQSGPISARKLLNSVKRKPIKYAKVIGIVSSGESIGLITAYTDDRHCKLSSMAYSNVQITTDDDGTTSYEVVSTISLQTSSSDEIMYSSIKAWTDKSKLYLLGIKKYASRIIVASFDIDTGDAKENDALALTTTAPSNEDGMGMSDFWYKMLWIESITIDDSTDIGRVVRIAGQDGRLPTYYRVDSLVIVGDDKGLFWKKFSHKNEHDNVQTEALAYCPDMNVAIAANSDVDEGVTALSLYQTSADHVTWSDVSFDGVHVIIPSANDGSSRGLPNFAHLVKCNAYSMTVVVTAKGGIAVGLRVDKTASSLVASRLWSTEEDIHVKSIGTGTDEL